LDWGCGSGIAAPSVLHHFGTAWASKILLWDRSPLAMEFAGFRLREKHPGLTVGTQAIGAEPISTLVLSHVLTELSDPQLEDLLDVAQRATVVLWVEPGTHATSRKLSALRERFRSTHRIVAPCTHQGPCGMLAPANGQHWCHHFASPPPAVFTDGDWTRFARLTGIDLRSLPLSFLVADQRPAPALPEGAERIIGRPRVYKGFSLLFACCEAGLHERRLTKRTLPELFRQVKKDQHHPVQCWECAGDEIVAAGEQRILAKTPLVQD